MSVYIYSSRCVLTGNIPEDSKGERWPRDYLCVRTRDIRASHPEFHGFYVKKLGLVILLPVRSIIFLTGSVVE